MDNIISIKTVGIMRAAKAQGKALSSKDISDIENAIRFEAYLYQETIAKPLTFWQKIWVFIKTPIFK